MLQEQRDSARSVPSQYKVSVLHGGVVSCQRITLDLPKACASCACAEFAAAEALCIGRSLALKQNRNCISLPPAEGIRGRLATVTVSGQTCVKPAAINHRRRITWLAPPVTRTNKSEAAIVLVMLVIPVAVCDQFGGWVERFKRGAFASNRSASLFASVEGDSRQRNFPRHLCNGHSCKARLSSGSVRARIGSCSRP